MWGTKITPTALLQGHAKVAGSETSLCVTQQLNIQSLQLRGASCYFEKAYSLSAGLLLRHGSGSNAANGSGSDPARKVRGEKVREVSLRVQGCNRDEVCFATLLWQNNGRQNGLISRMLSSQLYKIMVNKVTLVNFRGAIAPIVPLDPPPANVSCFCRAPSGTSAKKQTAKLTLLQTASWRRPRTKLSEIQERTPVAVASGPVHKHLARRFKGRIRRNRLLSGNFRRTARLFLTLARVLSDCDAKKDELLARACCCGITITRKKSAKTFENRLKRFRRKL